MKGILGATRPVFQFYITEDLTRDQRLMVRRVIGRILPIDIGKAVYKSYDGVITVENNEQRDARLARSSK